MKWTDLKADDMFLYKYEDALYLGKVLNLDSEYCYLKHCNLLRIDYEMNSKINKINHLYTYRIYYDRKNPECISLRCIDQEEILNRYAEYLI